MREAIRATWAASERRSRGQWAVDQARVELPRLREIELIG